MSKRAGVIISSFLIAFTLTGMAIFFGRSRRVEARSLYGTELLENLRGYLRVARIEEAAQVLGAIDDFDVDGDCLDQARYEVAQAYVAIGNGELAIALLDKITLHDRTFDFQRAVLREKIRGLYSFFFDPSGDLRTPAQLDDYVYHSRLNPDEKLRPKNPVGFDDPNKLIDYFEKVASQLEDVLEIQGLPRSEEPALAEGYDAIQILLYGRGEIEYETLIDNLAGSQTSSSAKTRYILGNQHFVEADYDRAFTEWGKLVSQHPESDEALRAFEKTFELFEGRRMLKGKFAFWPMERPAWVNRLAAAEPFKSKAAKAAERLSSHEDMARYESRPVLYEKVTREIFRNTKALGQSEEIVENPVIEPEEDTRLVLTRDRSLGWRLQTEFREFHIRRVNQKVLAPSEKKEIEVRTSYYGKVLFRVLGFASGKAYEKFRELDASEAVEAASKLPEVKSWTHDLGSMSKNGRNSRLIVNAPLSEQGFYLVTARARYAPVVAVTQMAIVSDKVLTWSSPTGIMYRAVDRASGSPVAERRIHGRIKPVYILSKLAPQFHDGTRNSEFLRGLSQGFHKGERDELTTDNDDFLGGFAEGLKLREKYELEPEPFSVKTGADGVARVAIPAKWKGHDCRVSAELGELGGVCPIESRCGQPSEHTSWLSLFYAERPIFLPGEKARVKGILRRRGHAGLSLPDREELEFMLWHRQSLLGVFRAAPNEVGTVSLEMPLPESAPLGAYHVTIGHTGVKYPVFKVDRFELPLLDISVKTDAEAVFAGSTARGRVEVRHAGLVPAVGLPVEVKVYAGKTPAPGKPYDPREDFFHPVGLVDYPDAPKQDSLKGELRGLAVVWEVKGSTAADGCYVFSFDTDRTEAKRYVIVARVKALSDRWEMARTEILTSTLPLFLTAEPERTHYYPGETLKAEVQTTGLDGKPVAAALRLFVTRKDPKGQEVLRIEDIKTDKEGTATISVKMGKRAPDIEIGVKTRGEWVRRPVSFKLRQIGASIGDAGLALKLDRKAYYPGEAARVTIEVDQPGADVFVTISREEILRTKHLIVPGSTGTFDVTLAEGDSPNVYLHAVSVWNDRVRTAQLELPVIPSHKFLKVEVITDKNEYVGGDAVSATIRVTDSKGAPARDVEVSLAAVRSPALAIQEDLTPDLVRYFLNHKRPLHVTLGSSVLNSDSPRSECFWLRAAFAWGIYSDLVSNIGLGGGGAGCFGYRTGGGRKRCVARFGGCRAASRAVRELFAEFLKQHGLTLFWEARLATDEKGEAKIEFLLPSDGGEFRFTARAVTGETFVGEIRKTVRYRRELIVQAPWPLSIREGERFRMPVFVVNGSAGTRRGRVSIESDLQVRVVSETPEVQVAPGGVARIDVEIDARSLPDTLTGAEKNWVPPVAFARFTAICTAQDGAKVESRAVVKVRYTGVPVKTLAVAVARHGEGDRTITFDLTQAVPGSARVEIMPLADPAEWVKWLVTGMRERGLDRSHEFAWAAEAGAERLAAPEMKAGKTLPIGRELMAAFSNGVSYVSDTSCAPYFLSHVSARKRGVAIPLTWAESAFQRWCRNRLDRVGPSALWALASYATGKPERLPDAERIAARLDTVRRSGVESAADWAYLALAFRAVERPTKASWCLDRGFFVARPTENAKVRRLRAEDAAALLLAGNALDLDAATMGDLYAALLEAISREPRLDAWPSAVAVHALTAWSRISASPGTPMKVSLGNELLTLHHAKPVVRVPEVGRSFSVSVAEPDSGALAAQVICSYRVLHSDIERRAKWRIRRSFARVTPDGHAELIDHGGAVRVGESLLMAVHTESPGGGLASVPLAGPWVATQPCAGMSLTRRVRRQFVLSRARRARVLAAAEAGRIDDVRDELASAVDSGDFIIETVRADKHLRASGGSGVSGSVDPLIFSPGGSYSVVFRPDRPGTFVAPTAWLSPEKGAPPVAATQPFRVTVLQADAELPPREANLRMSKSLRRSVSGALKQVSTEYLTELLEKPRAQIDARRIALEGVLRSRSMRAPDAYARLAWGNKGIKLADLADLASWRAELVEDSVFERSGANAPASAVLARALSTDEVMERIAGSPDLAEDPLRAYNRAMAIICFENVCRRDLYASATVSPASDGIAVKYLQTGDLIRRLPAERLDALLDHWDEEHSGKLEAKRGPSLKKVLSEWARRFGMEATFDSDVPDLEAGEFLVYLPDAGAVSSLDVSLQSMCLRARRKGRSVRIWLDGNLQEDASDAAMVAKGQTPEARLEAFLDAYTPGKGGLSPLFGILVDAPEMGGSRYTPRIQRAQWLDESRL